MFIKRLLQNPQHVRIWENGTETKEGLYAHYFVAGCGGGCSGAPEDLFRDADAKGNINISNGAW